MFVVFVCMYRSSVTAVHVERHCKSVKLIVRYTVATEKPLAFSVCAAIGQVRLPSTRPAGRFFTSLFFGIVFFFIIHSLTHCFLTHCARDGRVFHVCAIGCRSHDQQ